MLEGRFDWCQIVGVRHMFFFFRVNFMELKLFGLLSFGVSLAVGLGEKWNRRIVFSDVMQSERGLFAMFVAIKN